MSTTDPDRPGISRSAAHRSELVAVLPQLRQQVKQLHQTLDQARRAAASDFVPTDEHAPEAQAIDHAVTAARWMLDALDPAATPEDRTERLTEVAVRAGYVAGAAHARLAELQTLDTMAAEEEHRRLTAVELGNPIIDRAELDLTLQETDDAIPTTHRVTITVSDGRVIWTCPTLPLATPAGAAHLAVATALTQLSETLARALPNTPLSASQ